MNLPLPGQPLAAIREQFQQARQGGVRHREIAEKLQLSEGELIAAHIDAEPSSLMRATRLQPHWQGLLTAIAGQGEVMALTRNASCVHEKEGIYAPAMAQAQASVMRGKQIDLLCRFEHWQHGFSVSESSEKGVQRSLQFYDAAGTAVHKVFLRPHSHLPAYLALVEQFAEADQQPGIVISQPLVPNGVADFHAFLAAWEEVHDARDLHTLLSQCQGRCLLYLQQLAAETVQAVTVGSARILLECAAAETVDTLILVGNAGVTQAHQGPVDKVVVMGPWLNVLDPGFNLHLREDHIASAWIVLQSGMYGLFSSLVLLDSAGALIALFASANVAGKPETKAWAALIERLPKV